MFRKDHLDIVFTLSLAFIAPTARCADIEVLAPKQANLNWHTDYTEATRAAKAAGRMLAIRFLDPNEQWADSQFEAATLSDPAVAQQLERYTLARLDVDEEVTVDGQTIKVLDHPAFAEMKSRRGLAIIDFASSDPTYRARVVSAFPFSKDKYYTAKATQVILDLPPGTLTQRTIIFAVRFHPESPGSTTGEFDPVLADEAARHAWHQARIRLQGHHRWGTRFQRILHRMPDASSPQEVCAESWPGETLVEAAIECVHSWRQSPGHWSAVRGQHPLFGYDIQRGNNGIWYATGIFAGLRG